MMSNRVAGIDPLRRSMAVPPGPTIRFADRLTCTVAEACMPTGLGRTRLYKLMGPVCSPTTMIGGLRLVRVASLLELLAPR
jgi:hypothetical protein